MKRPLLTLLALLVCQPAHAQAISHSSAREAALINEIEKRVQLPPGASSMWVYWRKYTYMADKTVIGIYINQTMVDSGGVPSSTWVRRSQMPRISGGGCGVVTVFYDPAKKSSPEATCNPPE
jgi:hypothetical protein